VFVVRWHTTPVRWELNPEATPTGFPRDRPGSVRFDKN